MTLSRENLIDAIKCEGKNCLECSMLREKGKTLDSCVALVASTALELYEQISKLQDGIYKIIGKMEVEVKKDK